MKQINKPELILVPVLVLACGLFLFGCGHEEPLNPAPDHSAFTTEGDPFGSARDMGIDVVSQDGRITPPDLVSVDCFGMPLTVWPYTGAKLDGTPMDPVNVIFTGHADPVRIRAALLALDGDRSVLGLPDAYPFNQVWKDALGGGVQSTFAEDGRWIGSTIQLTLGEYQPIRFHLRLFRTAARTSDGLPVTMGAAHFEVLIPGTTDHQVLSWTAAKEIVVGDMMRTGLLDPAVDLMPTQVITQEPTFRSIIPAVYNALPPELLAIIGGPPPPVTEPVGIPNDGWAMVVRLAGPAPIHAGEFANATTVRFGQVVPRPYCSAGPYDYLRIDGIVDFHNLCVVDEVGQFSYEGGYTGLLTAVPINPLTGQPLGPSFTANVRGSQHGLITPNGAMVKAFDQKLTHEDGGPQLEFIRLHVGESGRDMYRSFYKCLDGN